MHKLHLLTSREIGQKCKDWLIENKSKLAENDIELSGDIQDCTVVVSVLYDTILKENYLKGKRSYNFHPGILPEYRGAGTFSWSIINNDKEVGITLHEIDSRIDGGNIINIEKFPCTKKDTAYTLFKRGESVIFNMFTKWVIPITTNKYTSTPQDDNNAHIYYRKDLNKIKDLTNFIRAFTYPGKDNAFYYNENNKKITISYSDE